MVQVYHKGLRYITYDSHHHRTLRIFDCLPIGRVLPYFTCPIIKCTCPEHSSKTFNNGFAFFLGTCQSGQVAPRLYLPHFKFDLPWAGRQCLTLSPAPVFLCCVGVDTTIDFAGETFKIYFVPITILIC